MKPQSGSRLTTRTSPVAVAVDPLWSVTVRRTGAVPRER